MYRRKDAFYRRAKATGYRSRAAFKLQELAQTGRMIRPGDRVVDLGAWPGGWLQVAAELVGPNGKVVGVDLRPLAPMPAKNVVTLVADIGAPSTVAAVLAACGGRADVIVADVAPTLSGIRARDAAQAEILAASVLALTGQVLRTDGRLVMKVFMSDDLAPLVGRLRRMFENVRTTRPEATRKTSAEIYVVASGFRGHPRAG